MYLNRHQMGLLATSKFVKNVEVETSRQDSDWITAIWDPGNPWTIDDFGPLIIPKKGMIIEINPELFPLYKNTMNEEWRHEISLNPTIPVKYTFSQDFYFVLGDHRHDSRDSRYTGFVAETDIIGKAILILFNSNKDKRYNKRFFKNII